MMWMEIAPEKSMPQFGLWPVANAIFVPSGDHLGVESRLKPAALSGPGGGSAKRRWSVPLAFIVASARSSLKYWNEIRASWPGKAASACPAHDARTSNETSATRRTLDITGMVPRHQVSAHEHYCSMQIA